MGRFALRTIMISSSLVLIVSLLMSGHIATGIYILLTNLRPILVKLTYRRLLMSGHIATGIRILLANLRSVLVKLTGR